MRVSRQQAEVLIELRFDLLKLLAYWDQNSPNKHRVYLLHFRQTDKVETLPDAVQSIFKPLSGCYASEAPRLLKEAIRMIDSVQVQ